MSSTAPWSGNFFAMTGDLDLRQVIKSLRNNRRFFVQLNDKKSKWKAQKNGLPQGSVLAPLLFNINTNNQPLPHNAAASSDADDLCITSQQENFQKIDSVLESTLQEMTTYYNNNHLKPNPSKTMQNYVASILKTETQENNWASHGMATNSPTTPTPCTSESLSTGDSLSKPTFRTPKPRSTLKTTSCANW